MNGISVKLPLSFSNEDGAYRLTKTLKENVKQNFKMLLLTIPGERMMDPDFGIGLVSYLFEMNNEITYSAISSKISEQVEKYMPFIEVKDMYIGPSEQNNMEESQLNVQIMYEVIPTSEEDILSIEVKQKEMSF